MSLAFFKDYGKEVKDLLSKNYQSAGAWKLESKTKGKPGQLIVNPNASNDGINADFEYKLTDYPASFKVNLNPKFETKLTTTYTRPDIGKIEATVDSERAVTTAYEGKHGKVAVNATGTKSAVSGGLSFGANENLALGAGATYNIDSRAINWTAGARYFQDGAIAAVTTADLKTYQTSVQYPFKFSDYSGTVAASVECGSGKFAATAGLEIPCVLIKGNRVRVRVNNNRKWAASYIYDLKNWTASVTIDDSLKPGLLFTYE